MLHFSFTLPTKIIFGINTCQSLVSELRSCGVNRPLIVTDKGIVEAGICDIIETLLKQNNLSYMIYTGVEANPKDYNVVDGANMAADFSADSIIAIGGGSPIDCAKAINVIATYGGKIRDFEGRTKVDGVRMPIFALPTTAGTGSEVTFGTVITDTITHSKFSIRGDSLAPKVAICDPNLTKSMPSALTASTGMDAITHAIEAYIALVHEPIADACALHAIRLISQNILTAVKYGDDIDARSNMLMGSVLAAIAFSHSDVASVHCISEALGGMYDLPHGLCNAVILPHVMEYNKNYCSKRLADIASVLGYTFSSDEEGTQHFLDCIKRLSHDVGIPSISSLGIYKKDIITIASDSVRNGSNLSNPRPMQQADYVSLLELALKPSC